MLSGFASPQGGARFAARFPLQAAAGFFNNAQGLLVSNIGIGSYLGEMNEATDRGYVEAVTASLRSGVNFIDTSLNYRDQRSERAIGVALGELLGGVEVQRDEIVVCTKAGYLVRDAIPEVLRKEDVVGGMHSMVPAFVADQLGRSRRNLGLETIDVFYLHNPETQLGYVSKDAFYERIREAFRFLEEAVSQGGIRYYGTATWNGFRNSPESKDALSLVRLEQMAQEVAGAGHHFRFIQLPFNLAMPEAFVNRPNGASVLDEARRLGISVVASASLLQSKLSRELPVELKAKLSGVKTDAQCAIQFVRSTPGIAVALIGMSNVDHVRENLALSNVRPAAEEEYLSIYTPA